jgi:SepF-like predicted cell division protein (DUF552 family)
MHDIKRKSNKEIAIIGDDELMITSDGAGITRCSRMPALTSKFMLL